MARLTIFLMAMLAPVTLLYAADSDVIVRSDDKTIPPLSVTRDDYLFVAGRHVVEIKVPSYLVKEVDYANESEDFKYGMQKLGDAKYSVAAKYFKEALDAAGDKKWALELYNYHLGSALYLNGSFAGYNGRRFNYDPPSAYFKRALDANPKSRFMLDIFAKRPVCLAGEQDFEAAAEALKDGERRLAEYQAETAATHDPGYAPLAQRAKAALTVAAARVLQMKAEAKKAEWKDVSDAWRIACNQATAFADLSQTAKRGRMNALFESQDIDGAKETTAEIIRKLSTEPDPRQWSLLSSAYFIQGCIQYQEALGAEQAKRVVQSTRGFAEARWSFVNAAVYAIEGGERSSAQLKAGICCDKLKRVEDDGAEKAVRYWKEVLRESPDGDVADSARAELKKAGF